MPVEHFGVRHLGPFSAIDFALDPRVNVLVGANNTGKTALLTAIGEVLVYPFSLPRKYVRKGTRGALVIRSNDGRSQNVDLEIPINLLNAATYVRVGNALNSVGYSAFLPALRVGTNFRATGPTTKRQRGGSDAARAAFLFATSDDEDTNRGEETPKATKSVSEASLKKAQVEFIRRRSLVETDATLLRDRSVIQALIDLDYRSYRRNEPSTRALIDRIGSIVSEITDGFPLRFSGVKEDKKGLYLSFETPDGDFPLNVLSQGTQSLVQCVVMLVLGFARYYDALGVKSIESPGTLIIDEIDAHLHPSWQRRVIPTLMTHFPQLQLICSTHSPLLLSGLKPGQIKLLRRGPDGQITITDNNSDIVGWSSDEVLIGLMGLDDTTDLATTESVQRLYALRRKAELTDSDKRELEALRTTVRERLSKSPLVPARKRAGQRRSR